MHILNVNAAAYIYVLPIPAVELEFLCSQYLQMQDGKYLKK